jgi:hypothetical protein
MSGIQRQMGNMERAARFPSGASRAVCAMVEVLTGSGQRAMDLAPASEAAPASAAALEPLSSIFSPIFSSIFAYLRALTRVLAHAMGYPAWEEGAGAFSRFPPA